MQRTRLWAPALLLACLVVAGCGSTLQAQGSQTTGGSTQQLGSAVGPSAGAVNDSTGGGATTTSGQQPSSAAGSTTGGASGQSGTITSGTGAAVTTAPSIPASELSAGPATTNGPATGAPVTVGFAYLENSEAFAAAFGASADPGNQQGYVQAAVAWANAHGGFNGHKIVALFYGVDATSLAPYATTAQDACDYFTEDNHVAAVDVNGIDAPDQLPECLSARKVLYTVSDHALHDSTDYQALPYMVTPAEVGLDRSIPALLNYAATQGLIPTGGKVGLLEANETTVLRVVANNVAPLLAARHVSLVTYSVNPPASTAQLEDSETQISSAVLRFKTDGVKTVTFICPNCMTQFMQAAASQGYYPHYAFTSLDSPSGLVASAKAGQLDGSVGIGWEPDRDVNIVATPTLFTNPTRALCTTIEKNADDINTTLRVFASQSFCDAVLFLRAAADASGATVINGTSLLAGADRLGSSQQSALTFSTDISASQHDGVTAFRALEYSTSCNCVQYAADVNHPIP